MTRARSGVCLVAYNDAIYALGGFNGMQRQACGEFSLGSNYLDKCTYPLYQKPINIVDRFLLVCVLQSIVFSQVFRLSEKVERIFLNFFETCEPITLQIR